MNLLKRLRLEEDGQALIEDTVVVLLVALAFLVGYQKHQHRKRSGKRLVQSS
jgi:Flp pilus assembly pilin Flp